MTARGYHLRDITRGEVGEVSKILEEAYELLDAQAQGVKIMQLVELSDLVGAIQCYLDRHHPGTGWKDLVDMSLVTKRAFQSGARQPRPTEDAHVAPTDGTEKSPTTLLQETLDYDHVPEINYERLTQAVEYYQIAGFQMLPVPWIVPDWAIDATLPQGEKPTRTQYGALVGSAEQSFVYLTNRDRGGELDELSIPKGRYVAMSPCFRCDPDDSIHYKYFMKAEVFSTDPDDLTAKGLLSVVNLAIEYFSRHVPGGVQLVRTGDESYDILSIKGGLELGSYGIRRHPNLGEWLYGTACAEPRMGQAKVMDFKRSKSEVQG